MSARARRTHEQERPHQEHRASLRPLGLPAPVQVRTGGDGLPEAVARRAGQWQRVEQIDDLWRIAEEWWRETPQQRTYVRVILETGRPCTLFLDAATGAWFQQEYS